MEKLTKENVYIYLRGKSKEELIDIYNLLISLKQNMHDSLESDLINMSDWKCYEFYEEIWCLSNNVNKQEVTIEQLKEIIKPMENKQEQLRKEAKRRGYTHDNFKCLINRELEELEDIDKWYYEDFSDTLYTMPNGEGGNVVYRKGVWAELIQENLEQQLQKAEAEVKRLQSLIEEENKPKVGDWAILWEEGEETPVIGLITDVTDYFLTCNGSWENGRKITDQELINKLNELIK